ncbi:MAG: 8-oxo-dGTP diphosphatase [Lachnospiraceae bacterium]|nr:8-oxo-dGTP diphosphatase [Lachnospiraceae bacterium]
MRLTTICYIEKDGNYLMLHRTKKKNDQSHDKWLGVGGKFEKNESPEDCVLREVREETGYTLTSFRLRGIMTFISDIYETEYMFIYTADGFEGEESICSEGELQWIPKQEVLNLNIWEGDVLFLKKLIADEDFFSIKVEYEGDHLIKADVK